MLKKIFNDLKYILSNEGGFWIMAAMAVASIVSSNKKEK